jgi:deoxyhypusine synthase
MFDDDSELSHEDLIEMIGEFMTGSLRVEDVYRSHLCDTLVQRVYDEFGTEGMAELMMKIDSRADWITDMLFDANDLHDAMFKRHGTFDEDISFKARTTMAMGEMNKKMWNLRKRYIGKIVDEIWDADNPKDIEESAAP